jgi:hypothetical protein
LSCGICGGQSDTGTGFLRALQFPLPILIPPAAGTIGQKVADVPSGLSLTPPQETKRKIHYKPTKNITTIQDQEEPQETSVEEVHLLTIGVSRQNIRQHFI